MREKSLICPPLLMKIFEFRDFLFGKNGVYLEISSFFTETSDWKEQNTDSDNGFENALIKLDF